MMNSAQIPWWLLLRGCGRSFLHQASWNFERMQNLGFLYQVLPGLRRLYGGSPPAAVLQRYAGYFNTHPYLSTWVAGTALRLEERQQAGEAAPVDATAFQNMVMAPYAAIGDALFWGALRPLAAVIGLFLAVQGIVWAPLVMLALFNLPHLACRCAGWLIGYVQELRSVETLQRLRLPDVAIWLKEGTIILLGVLCAFLAARGCEHQAIEPLWGLILLPVVLLFAGLVRRGVTSFALVVMTTVSLLGLALVLR
jgi:PTS system mannose-specific IID component